MTLLGMAHFAAALTALGLGAAVFQRPKGGRRHRALGRAYLVSMVCVNASALSVYEESQGMGPFHFLALLSLATLTAGVIPAVARRPYGTWFAYHAYLMCWSYVGLLAAGVSQLVTLATSQGGVTGVVLPTALVMTGGAVLIHTRVPAIVARLSLSFDGPGRHQPSWGIRPGSR